MTTWIELKVRKYRRIARSTIWQPWSGEPAQIVHCSHHKVGTVWFVRALQRVAKEYRASFGIDDPSADVVVYNRPRAMQRPDRRWSGTHMIRDPRDVVVSGYHYHLWTREAWAREPSDTWGGRSYQEHLNMLPEDEGLAEEIRFASLSSLREMSEWDGLAGFLELRYEDVLGNEREWFRRIFLHHGFKPRHAEMAAEWCDLYSLSRRSDTGNELHIRSGRHEQWRDEFNESHIELFEALNPGLVERLGYTW